MAEDPKTQTAKKGSPSNDLGPEHMTALSLVGTVALPSPFPATARILVIRHPLPPGSNDESSRKYHIKIVQPINDSCTITRFVDHKAVSLIRFYPANPGESSQDGPLKLDQAAVQKLVSDQQWDVLDERASHEIEPYPQHTGVVQVPEAQPVLLRYDVSVPAATSLEQVMGQGFACPHTCCCTHTKC